MKKPKPKCRKCAENTVLIDRLRETVNLLSNFAPDVLECRSCRALYVPGYTPGRCKCPEGK